MDDKPEHAYDNERLVSNYDKKQLTPNEQDIVYRLKNEPEFVGKFQVGRVSRKTNPIGLLIFWKRQRKTSNSFAIKF